MSKTKSHNNRYDHWDDYDDYSTNERMLKAELKKHRKEKKIRNALRARDIEVLMHEYEDEEN